MKKLLTLLLLLQSAVATALAGDFYVGLTSSGANFWTCIPQAPVLLINNAIGGGCIGYNYDWIRATDSRGSLKIDNGSFFGFKARDIFNNFSYGLIVGYQPFYSPFGVYAKASYKYRQFRMQPDHSAKGMDKYQIPAYSFGVGVRVTPFIASARDAWGIGVTPVIDLGTCYNKAFSCRAPYGNDDSQFGSGMSMNFGLGLRFINNDNERSFTVSLNFEMSQYDYFNRDFTTSSGVKPYANIKSKYYCVGLSLYREF